MRPAVMFMLLVTVVATAILSNVLGETSDNAESGVNILKTVSVFSSKLQNTDRPAGIQATNGTNGKVCAYPCIPPSCEDNCGSGKCPYWCCLCDCDKYTGLDCSQFPH
jgi:hypothetical protein